MLWIGSFLRDCSEWQSQFKAMKEVSPGDKVNRIASGDNRQHNLTRPKADTSGALTAGRSSLQHPNEKRNPARRKCNQVCESDKASTGDACDSTNESKTNKLKTSSRRGKLSLRRLASHQGKSKDPKEVIKAILGETTLDQSSDFKEPHGRGSAHGPKGSRRKGSSLSRPKNNKSSNTRTTSEISSRPNYENADQSDETGACDKKTSKCQCDTLGSSCSAETKNDIRVVTSDDVLNTKKSPIKGCSVYVSKLKLTTDSSIHSGNQLKDPVSLPKVQCVQQSSSQDAPHDHTDTINCSNEELRPSSIPERIDPKSQTTPSAPSGLLCGLDDDSTQKHCPVCQETFWKQDTVTENMQEHIQQCLRKQFAVTIKARDTTGNSGTFHFNFKLILSNWYKGHG